ncbi:uncharacterized protein Dwil_GK17016 [Drosophila willistoni]|uniref:ubiquitinyl hydrolase 1 n=1 Tax=Drosophila willistoni TaxID=7260 RepID=B4MKP7_DROWI|nr:uncharacterized protein LOC6638977 [Drosophila willistoni]EDW72753.1 uncharacterized protein Dwil_GK17016 [Drosophila willistoni]
MTIKPVSAPSAKRVSVSGNVVDAENKEPQVVVVGGEQSVVNQTHRNVVIDGHSQSPQRRNVEVYDELARTHRCSPHKSSRSKRRDHHDERIHHHKRDRLEREKLTHSTAGVVSVGSKSPLATVTAAAVPAVVNTNGSPAAVGRTSPEHSIGANTSSKTQTKTQLTPTAAVANLLNAVEETFSGYNSGDEHLQPKDRKITAEEWQRRDNEFAKFMEQRGYELKPVEEDGACLFRSISLQIYGDEEMHDVIRQHTMDYIHENREYFGQFVTEDINNYIQRKRARDAHGNHIEIQAISEIYSRTVEVYCYQANPINIFNSEQSQPGYPPLRLSYQRGSHYNAILDPYNATVGVGLGLAGYKPALQTKEAVHLSEQLEIEQTMFEDKLKTTDWEATNEAIEEQIARESYLQWCRDNMQRTRSSNPAAGSATSTSTVTSAEALTDSSDASPSKYSGDSGSSPTASSSKGTDSTVSTAFGLSPKTLNQFGHKLAPPPEAIELGSVGGGGSGANANGSSSGSSPGGAGGGYDSDATDMSSTSSLGHGPGSASPNTATTNQRSSKSRRSNGSLRKKRRHEARDTTMAGQSQDVIETPVRKSPKCDAVPPDARAQTPEADQQPCTSKQSSNSPPKRNDVPASSFYQELLEASYANDGVNESEMLQRAIQMSTRDYMEDQKRKYFTGP